MIEKKTSLITMRSNVIYVTALSITTQQQSLLHSSQSYNKKRPDIIPQRIQLQMSPIKTEALVKRSNYTTLFNIQEFEYQDFTT
jgi:hypothetical protein